MLGPYNVITIHSYNTQKQREKDAQNNIDDDIDYGVPKRVNKLIFKYKIVIVNFFEFSN